MLAQLQRFVFEGDLPRSSYVLPLRQLALASYFLLFVLALETIVVYNIESLSDVREHFRQRFEMREARQRLRERRAERERERLLMKTEASVRGGNVGGVRGAGSSDPPPGPPRLWRRLSRALLSWPAEQITAIRRTREKTENQHKCRRRRPPLFLLL